MTLFASNDLKKYETTDAGTGLPKQHDLSNIIFQKIPEVSEGIFKDRTHEKATQH